MAAGQHRRADNPLTLRGSARGGHFARLRGHRGQQDGFTTRIGDSHFTAFRTGGSKSREAFLSHLRAGHGEYVISEAALGTAMGSCFRFGGDGRTGGDWRARPA